MFKRTDEAFRASYGLLKLGDMSKPQSLMWRVLNPLLVPEEERARRKLFIDGKDLPVYKVVQRYLGPAGSYVRTDEDGLLITGCLLTKPVAK